MNFYFVIFAAENDMPVYELECFKPDVFKGEDSTDLHKFIVHAALDMVDELQFSPSTGSSPYLRVVDRYNEWMVSAYLAAGGERLVLLHDVKNEEAVRQFFVDANELLAKHTLNPFYQRPSPIFSGAFDRRIRQASSKYIN